MADPTGEPIQVAEPTILTKIADKIQGHHSSSSDSISSVSSDVDDHKPSHASAVTGKIHRLFGRDKPVHKVLGGGKYADVLLWRNKKMSVIAVGGVTTIWVLFEMLEYHFITLVCHILIMTLAILFMWSKLSFLINKSPPQVPDIQISDTRILEVASVVRTQMNRGLIVLRDIAAGRDLRTFLTVIFSLWIISAVGNWFNFLTLIYLIVISLHTLPALYEKYEDQVDPIAEKALIELKKHYAVFDEKVMSKIPNGVAKGKKRA